MFALFVWTLITTGRLWHGFKGRVIETVDTEHETLIGSTSSIKVQELEVVERTAQLAIGFDISVLRNRIGLITGRTVHPLRFRYD